MEQGRPGRRLTTASPQTEPLPAVKTFASLMPYWQGTSAISSRSGRAGLTADRMGGQPLPRRHDFHDHAFRGHLNGQDQAYRRQPA